MYRSQNEVIRTAKEYLKLVNKVFHVKKAYLYGSYARGTQNESSDIDIAVFSSDFRKIPRPLAMKFLTKMTMEFDTSIEPVAFTDEEEKTSLVGSLAHEVVTTGIEIEIIR